MGVVYLARDVTWAGWVAVKVLVARGLFDHAGIDGFLSEARILAGFSHPNIVTVVLAGRYEGQTYLAMEYVEGRTLRHRVEEKHRCVSRRCSG